MKNFLCKYAVRIGDTEVDYYHLDTGNSEAEVALKNEVEHDECGLDTPESPVGGGVGEKCTELVNVYKITPAQKKFLNSVGIY